MITTDFKNIEIIPLSQGGGSGGEGVEIKNQAKGVTITENGTQTVRFDNGYTGLSQVGITVDVPIEEFETQSKTIEITENGTMTVEPDSDFEGLIKVTINTDVAVPTSKTKDKKLTIKENGTMTLTPDEGYIGLNEVGITVNVPNSGGSGEGGNIFSAIGYPSTPDFIAEGIAYAEEVKNRWATSKTLDSDRLVFFPLIDLTDWSANFSDMKNLMYVPALDLSYRDNLRHFFQRCSRLQFLDCANWNTSNVTEMQYLFSECTFLKNIDCANWNTANVNNMNSLFNQCNSLENIDIKGWRTSNVKNMSYMFAYCKALKSLDLSGWDVSNVTTFNYMFANMSSLETLNISNWDTSNVTDFSSMFYVTSSMKYLNLGNLTMAKCTSASNMFGSTSNLRDFIWNNLGDGENVTTLTISNANLGVNDSTYPNARQHLTDTFVSNSYDRATAGYAPCKLSLNKTTKALFTEEEIAAMTAKGYTIA